MTTREAAQAAAEELRLENKPERQRRKRLQKQMRAEAEDVGGEQATAAAAVADARAVLEQLNQKHQASVSRQDMLKAARRAVGFAAHTGDAKARAELDGLNAEGAVIAGEVESLAAAVEEAQMRLVTAQDGVRLAEERRRAREVEQRLARIREIAPMLDQLLATFTRNYPEFAEQWAAIADLGPNQPRVEMVNLHQDFVIATALGGRGIKIGGDEVRGPPMAHRRTFSDLVEVWSTTVASWVARRLDPDAAA